MNIIKFLTISLKGFAVFFSIIITIKFSAYFLGFAKLLNIEVIDVYHSFLGSALFILSNYSKRFIQNA
jgi:hypothetical protein